MMRTVRTALLAAAMLALSTACAKPEPPAPVRIGVMLPLSGENDLGLGPSLEWARDAVNKAGGVAGRPLELVWRDLATTPVEKAADELLADPSVVAAIGPDTSDDVFAVADRFIAAKKLLVSPSATAGDIFRAFGGRGYVWRTVESDVSQTLTMLLQAVERKHKQVALWTDYSAYGATFFDWFGFFAAELGLSVSGLVRRDSQDADCVPSLNQALAGEPEMLFVATNSLDDIACLVGEVRRRGVATQLYFSDGAAHPALPARLGSAGVGLEGLTLAAEPSSGWRERYQATFGQPAPPFSAQAYDALTMVAYGLERSGGVSGDQLAAALPEVLHGDGAPTGWDEAGIADGLRRLRAGERPDLSGATGPLKFDDEKGTDPVESTYRLWQIKDGQFDTTGYWSTKGSEHSASSDSALRTEASKALESSLAAGATDLAAPVEREKLWAVVAALSNGWENYRHQADALAMYQVLKASGVSDDHIILILQDDLADDPQNPEPGVVRNVAGGPNLREGVQIDYRLSEVGPADFLAILEGRRSPTTPKVLDSTSDDDVLVYMVGHGASQGIYVAAGDAAGKGSTGYIDAASLGRTLDARRQAGGYRRMLLVAEACQSGTLGPGVTAPRALMITAASATENSFSTNWDPVAQMWRADQFSWSLYTALRDNPARSVADLYQSLYRAVPGSHVGAFNARSFGNPALVPATDFATP